MRRVAVMLAAVIFALPCVAQGGAELDALAAAFFAKDLKTVMQHLPPELAKAIAEASPQMQRDLAERFLIARMLERDSNVKLTRPESGPVLVVQEKPPRDDVPSNRVEVYLDKRMYDGNETMLRFKVKTPHDEDWGPAKIATFFMRYVEGEWRLYDIEMDRESVKLDDPKFIEEMVHIEGHRSAANEASAVGSMRTLNTALVTYASTYPDIGFPNAISALAGDGSRPDRAGLIDSVLGTSPYEKSGYRFSYVGNKEEYKISGRPMEVGVTGTRSFFTDQSGVIRYTNEDREPTAEDSPLQ